MKLRFESWVQDQGYDKDAESLFGESILCYKIGAYKAAIIMSYLGMQTVIRKRVLLTSTTPERIEPGSWTLRQKKIKNDTEWDKEVFDLVNMGLDRNPFIIGDDIRKQYDYWRTIRNTCAHAKSDIIDSSHVESLWLFIESTLNKFIINGGKDYISNVILTHLDPNFTIPNKPISHLVDSILEYVYGDELQELYEELHIKLYKSGGNNISDRVDDGHNVLKGSGQDFNFWLEINSLTRSDLRSAFHNFIVKDDDMLHFYLTAFPDVLESLRGNQQNIRNIWKEKYWEWDMPWYVDGWSFFMYLLVNSFIEEEEIDEFLKLLRRKNGMFPPEKFNDYLKTFGYFDDVEENLFNESNFGMNSYNYCNSNIQRFLKIIKINGFNDTTTKLLNRELKSMSFGEFVDGMVHFFKKNPVFKQSFIDIADRLGLEIAPIIITEE